MTEEILLSHNRILPSSYPTAKTSLSDLLCAMAVTGIVHLSSLQRFVISPFLISQQRTSSFAATIACPALVPVRSFEDHTMFEVGEATTPKNLPCSYFLLKFELD